MIEQKQIDKSFTGCIINVSSCFSDRCFCKPWRVLYFQSGYQYGYTLFAVRLGEYDIPVYEVRPGVIIPI
jgi:hypothetical protein